MRPVKIFSNVKSFQAVVCCTKTPVRQCLNKLCGLVMMGAPIGWFSVCCCNGMGHGWCAAIFLEVKVLAELGFIEAKGKQVFEFKGKEFAAN